MNPRHTPFLRLLLPWLAGLAAGNWLDRPLPGLGAGILAGIILLVFLASQRYEYRFRWAFGGALMLLLAAAGYHHVVQYDERRQAGHFTSVCPAAGVFTGVIADAPARGGKVKVHLRLESAGARADSLRACTGNVLLFLEPTPASEALRYGDRLWVQAGIRPTEPPRNPCAFDYRRYLHYQNIHYLAFVKDRSYGIIATGGGHLLWRVAFRWRDRLLAMLREHFPGTDEYAVASALLVGYKDELSEDLRTAYAETGSMHALAISGTHVGLLYAGLMFLLRRLPWTGRYRRWGETLTALTAIWAFALVTGATASVLRASLMFTAYLGGKAIYRQASVWNIMAASAFILLLIDPYMLFDAGFQLSYVAVAGLVFFFPYFKKLTPPLPNWMSAGRDILLIGIAAQLGTLPLSLFYFHQFPVYFWLSGWVVVLGGALFLWGGAILVVLSALAPGPAAWLGIALYHLVWGMNTLIRTIRDLPGSVVAGIWISSGIAALLYVFIGTLAGAFLLNRARWLLAALSVLVLLGLHRAVETIGRIQQRRVVLYHVNRQFLFDIFDGESLSIWSDTLSARQEKFAAQANRLAHGMRSEEHWDGSSPYTTPNLYFQPPFLQFYDQKFAVLDQSTRLTTPEAPPVSIDVLILRGNPRLQLSDCFRQFPCRLVVLAASNSRRRVEDWKAECRILGIPVYDVQAQGAWVANVTLKQPI